MLIQALCLSTFVVLGRSGSTAVIVVTDVPTSTFSVTSPR